LTDLAELERRLWAAADALRANSTLTPAEYREPVLGLIFLAFAEHRFEELRPEIERQATARQEAQVSHRGRRVTHPSMKKARPGGTVRLRLRTGSDSVLAVSAPGSHRRLLSRIQARRPHRRYTPRV
jgi:hypothetical protein